VGFAYGYSRVVGSRMNIGQPALTSQLGIFYA